MLFFFSKCFPLVCNLDCNFDSNLCSWDQTITDAFDWTWQRGSTPTLMTGPSADHTGANSASYGDTARLISSECSDSGPQCLQFWYHMYGSADTMGLHVYLLQNRIANQVWRKQNDQGNMWHLAQVDIEPTTPFQVTYFKPWSVACFLVIKIILQTYHSI
uniref:MAM domain-containing protein n=1 Tax=Maylandia zebra TaxID=106582 RepID=A0A3P9CXZ6_9CICH